MTTEAIQATPSFNPVQYTRQASRAFSRGRTRFRDVFVDVYTAVLAVGTIGALAAGLVLALREQVAQAWNAGSGRTLVAPPSFSLPDVAAAAVLVFAALVAVMTVARKLGPAAVSGPEGYWWLSLPLERRPMVAGWLVRRLLLVWAGASVLYLPFGFITDLEAGAWGSSSRPERLGWLLSVPCCSLPCGRPVPALRSQARPGPSCFSGCFPVRFLPCCWRC